MKRIVILGSTGSIGTNTLDIISKFTEKFQAVGLTANGNVDKLEEQVRTFSPAVVAMADQAAAERLRGRRKGLKTTILSGTDWLPQTATLAQAGLVISAIIGRAGHKPPEVEGGPQAHHPLGAPEEQGPGGRGGPVAVQHPRLEDRSGGPPREHHPLARRIRGPLGDRPARPSGHADPDRLRDELPGARPAGSPFSEPGPDRHAHVLQPRS